MSLRNTLESVKEQMENESQLKIQQLIEQHRAELGMCHLDFMQLIPQMELTNRFVNNTTYTIVQKVFVYHRFSTIFE